MWFTDGDEGGQVHVAGVRPAPPLGAVTKFESKDMTTNSPNTPLRNCGFTIASIIVSSLSWSQAAQASGQARPYRLVWVDDLGDQYSMAQIKLFPDGTGNGALPELLRFRIDEVGNIVGTSVVESAGMFHPRATVWVAASSSGSGSRMRLVFPSLGTAENNVLDSVATSVSTNAASGVLHVGGAIAQSGVCTPAVWSVSVSAASPPALTPPSSIWAANALGIVQAVGPGVLPMVAGAVTAPSACHPPVPFMHDTAGAGSLVGEIVEPCGWADSESQTVPMEMQGSAYAIVAAGASNFGFGWRVCSPCSVFPQQLCDWLSGGVQYEQFARWVPGAGAGSWQFTPPGYVTTDSRALTATVNAAAGWSRSRGVGSGGSGALFPCGESHATVLAFGGGSQSFMDVHYALNTYDNFDGARKSSRVADMCMAPTSWCVASDPTPCPSWLLVGARFGAGGESPLESGSSSRGVLWQGNAVGDWCGKRAEALCVNLPSNKSARVLEVRAVHSIGSGGCAVAVGYLSVPQGDQVTNWGGYGPKLMLMTHPADYNGDLHIDGSDLGLLLSHWGSSDYQYDIDGDGAVNGSDLGLMLGAWTSGGTFVSIPKWDCEGGWQTLPIVAASTLAAQFLGFEDLDELGSFAASQDPATANTLAFEAAVIAQTILN